MSEPDPKFKRFKYYVQMKNIKRNSQRWQWAMSSAFIAGIVFFQFPGMWRQVTTCFLATLFCLACGMLLSMTTANLEKLAGGTLDALEEEFGPHVAEIERRMREEKAEPWDGSSPGCA